MNGAHLHLVLIHLPIAGTIFGLGLLIYALARKQEAVLDTALGFVLVAAVLTLPAYFSGEAAEEVVEHIPEVSEKAIHEHEEAAELALLASLVTGSCALTALLVRGEGKESARKKLTLATLLVLTITTGIIGWTAYLGGSIRHPEIHGDGIAEANA